MFIRLLGCLCILFGTVLSQDQLLIIGHRGSPGILPEHTLEGYHRAVDDGADFIECDVHFTADNEPICRHDIDLAANSNVLDHSEFSSREDSVMIYGSNVTAFFIFNFTLAEVRVLRAIQPLDSRDPSYDNLYAIPTLAEYLAVVRARTTARDIPVGAYIELKMPLFYRDVLGVDVEGIIIRELQAAGFPITTLPPVASPDSDGHGMDVPDWTPLGHEWQTWAGHLPAPLYLQSFEQTSLRLLRDELSVVTPLIYLLWDDFADVPLSLEEVTTDDYLEEISMFAAGIGVYKYHLIHVADENTNRTLVNPPEGTGLARRAHNHGLRVHAFTFRNEYHYMTWDMLHDPLNELRVFTEGGVDAVFTDFSATASRFTDIYYSQSSCSEGSDDDDDDGGDRNAALEHVLSSVASLFLVVLIVVGFRSARRVYQKKDRPRSHNRLDEEELETYS